MLLLILLSFVPGLIWLWYFYRQDPRPEPVSLIGKTFLWGAFFVLPTAAVESLYSHYFSQAPNPLVLFLMITLGVGLVEEAAKFGAVWAGALHSQAFDEPVDGIIYAVTAALGFAALENLLYGLRFGVGVVPARALITLLAHASFSGIWGASLTRGRFGRTSWGALGIAAFLHGAYYFILARGLPQFWAVFLLLASYLYLRQLIRKATERGKIK